MAKQKKQPKPSSKRYRTVAALVNALSGPNSEFARNFRENLKKKKK